MYRVIGHPTPRVDGPDKVTGKALYTADVHLPGMLWGKVIRSPFPHALITRLDTTSAKDIPGVHAILTGDDVHGVLYGRRLIDVPVLAQGRVRFVGEPVAAVAAVNQDTAQEALDLIEVEYQELPAVFLPLEALKEDAPILHPEVNGYEGLPKPQENPSNAFVRDTWGKGDLEEGFQQAEVIVENTFHTPPVHHAYLEPHCCLVWIDKNSRIQIWAPNKVPYMLRRQIAQALNIPEGRILVNHAHIGGDFGGKGSPMSIPLCYFLALHSGRPVKMVMDYVEEFMAANPRHSAVIHVKTGTKRDGTLLASQIKAIFNSGAYGGFKPLANLMGPSRTGSPYRIPHVHIEATQVYTNTVPCGHMRAPGEPQVFFAWESQMDIIARQLNMDPLEFRLKNLIQEGDETPAGIRYQEVKVKETLMAAVEKAHYQAPKLPNIGRGIAIGERGTGGGETHVAVTLNPDGSVVLSTSLFEQGSGTYTTLQQIVAEELGLPAEHIHVQVWDTDRVPFDTGVGGSRVTRIASAAAYEATQNALRELILLTMELLGWPEDRIVFTGSEVKHRESSESHPWKDLLLQAGRTIIGKGSYAVAGHAPATAFAVQVAEVSVDTETGKVELLGFTTAHDVGKVINPTGHRGQIYGGIIQGIGYALMEELRMEEGRVTNPSFGDYKIPSIIDIPEMGVALVESKVGSGPYGVKSIGEISIVPVAAAIANAVEDAVGVRIRDLPIKAEKIYQALQNIDRR